MDLSRWLAGGHTVMRDVYVNAMYLSRQEAQDTFQLQPGQHLQCAKIMHTVRSIWPGYPAEPEESQTLNKIGR